MREGWTYKKLGEVCTIIGRIGFRGYKRTDYVESENEGAISLSPSNIIDGKLDYSKNTYITWEKYEESPEIKIFDGDVLLVKTASVGKSAIVRNLPHEATINPQFVVFKNIITNNEYLAYVIKSVTFLRQLQQITSGSSVPTLSQKALAELIIPLPPKSQQEAIVSELDEINSLLALKREQLQKYDKLAQSLFYEMFGDPVENEKEWEVKKYGEEFEIGSGGTPSKIKKEYWENGNIPWIGSNMCQNCVINETDGKYITQSGLEHSSAKLLSKGTVLVALVGATIGKVALLKTETSTNQNIAFIKVSESDNYVPEFVYFHLMSMYGEFMNIGNGDFKMANLSFVRSLPIPLPPLSLQQQFASRIEQIESQKYQVQAAIEKLETLLASRMQYWFE